MSDEENEQDEKTPTVHVESNGSSKGLAIVSYITWIGFIVALIAGDWKNDELLKKNINQSLVLNLFALLDFIPVIGWIWAIVVCVLWIMALVGACGKDGFKEVPLLGKIKILKG